MSGNGEMSAPPFWRAEDKAWFAEQPPTVQERLLSYERQRDAAVERVRREASEPKGSDAPSLPVSHPLSLDELERLWTHGVAAVVDTPGGDTLILNTAGSDAYARLPDLIAALRCLRGALRPLYEACVLADNRQNLSEEIDGPLLDAAHAALGDPVEPATEGGDQFGEPIPYYNRGEDKWPELWRLPDEMLEREDAELTDKVAAFSDDVLLRQAVHCWDNSMRLPGSSQGVAVGLLSAFARFTLGCTPANVDVEGLAAEMAEALKASMREVAVVRDHGWSGGEPS